MTRVGEESAERRTRFVAGTVWMVAMRWGMRLVGLFSSIILARLLAPEDFGLVAMAMIFVALVDSFSDTGVDMAIIRDSDKSDSLYNAAWTMQVFQGSLISLVLVFSAPFAADYFGEPKLSGIIAYLAIGHFVYGFKNIGVVEFRKSLKFAKEFRYLISVRLLSFFTTVLLAFWLRDYRAMVFGMIAKSVFELLLSYIMHHYRPHFSLQGIGKIWKFSQWLLAASVIGVVNAKAGQFFVGGSLGVAVLGFYYLASEFGGMFVQEIVMPMSRGLFPNLSLLQDDSEAFTDACTTMLGVVALLCCPIGIGLGIVSQELISLFFGQKWLEAAPIFKWATLISVIGSISITLNLILMVKNRLELSTLRALLECCVLIPVLYVVASQSDPVLIAMSKFAVMILFVPLTALFVSRVLECRFSRLLGALWRPFVAAAFMYFFDTWLFEDIQIDIFSSLLLHSLVGALSYFLCLYALWAASGHPRSAEHQVLLFSLAVVRRQPGKLVT